MCLASKSNASAGSIDPITMKPDQLIFAHWKLGDTYSSTLEDLRTVARQSG